MLETRRRTLCLIGTACLVLLAPPLVHAADWTLRLEPTWVDPYGNDRHVLTIHESNTGTTPTTERMTAIDLELERTLQMALGLRRMGGSSGWGMDIWWYGATVQGIGLNGAGDATTPLTYEADTQTYTSNAPATVLYYILREDNRLEVWTADFFYIRTLGSSADASVEIQAGVRFGDFDNDYRSALGIQGVEGTFLDASSNYPRMMGPLVGLNVRFRHDRSRIEAYIGQSLIVGRAELQSQNRHFNGPFSEVPEPTFDAETHFHDWLQVAVPITELRLRYTFELTDRWAVGAGASTSAWLDVSVPPTSVPPQGNAGAALQENTVVFYNILAHVEWRFGKP